MWNYTFDCIGLFGLKVGGLSSSELMIWFLSDLGHCEGPGPD